MTTPEGPITRFEDLLQRATAAGPWDATAGVLATASSDGRPSARVVLLKGVDLRGFVFYTNRESRKGRELARNPVAALCFHYPALGEQARIEGKVERVSDEECDAYFATRPRGSQIGAWASAQSEPIASRDILLAEVAQIE